MIAAETTDNRAYLATVLRTTPKFLASLGTSDTLRTLGEKVFSALQHHVLVVFAVVTSSANEMRKRFTPV